MKKNYAAGPLALLERLKNNSFVPVRHHAGLPQGWTSETLPDGSVRETPDYTARIHDLQVPVKEIQVRTHPNGNDYLVYNPMYMYGRENVGTWNVIRCDGGSMEVIIDIDQDVSEQITLHVSGRDTPVIIPPKTKQYRFGMHNCAGVINAGQYPALKSIDCDELVTLDKVKFTFNIVDYGTLGTAQKNIIPVWSA